MQVEWKDVNKIAIIRPQGNLNAVVIDKRREEWFAWLSQNEELQYLIIDLSGVSFLDSSGMGLLIAMLKRLKEKNGELKIAGMNKNIRLIFEITRTYTIFDIYDNCEEALRTWS